MSVDTTTQGREHIDSPPLPKSVPLARVIAASLIAGAVSALVLVLVVFPGATESVITGSALRVRVRLGDDAGPVRQDDQPPPAVATIPAVAMTATGAGSWSSRRRTRPSPPSIGCGLRRCWRWPAGCSSRCAAPPGRGRWLLTPVVVLLAVASIGATAENVVADRIESTYPAPGKTYAVGDHRLHLNCEGTGGPTVVLFNGMGEFSASWARSPTRSAPPPGSAPTTAPARAGATTSRARRTA